MKIIIDDLRGREIAAFIKEHIEETKSASPQANQQALNLESLRQPNITFWTVWDDKRILACGAIKKLNSNHAEIKSLRTATSARRQGIASLLLQHLLKEAKLRGYQRISLETGSTAFFTPAHRLYVKHGFQYCAPFANYKADPNSVFMTKEL